MRRLVLVIALGLWGSAPAARAADLAPETWEVVHRQTFRFARGEVPVTLSWEDGLRARRFHLRLDGGRAFDAKLVRARDGTILYSGRRAVHHDEVIPWGRDEIAHLTVDTRAPDGVQVVMELAVDPREHGLEVYSLEVNHFLRLYEEGRLERAREALAFALAEDPTDSVAVTLWNRLWRSEGMTVPPSTVESEEEESERWLAVAEGQRLQRMRAEIDAVQAEVGPDSALARLAAAPAFRTRTARRSCELLRADLAIACDQHSRATLALYQALDASEGFDERGEVYRRLVEENQRLGNDQQARVIQQRALAEAPDASARRWVERWLPRQR